jgi:hypothetical protein
MDFLATMFKSMDARGSGGLSPGLKPRVESAKPKKKEEEEYYFDQMRDYSISFNCMRNGQQIPISYSLGCVYSLYDLAETQLEAYYSHTGSYGELVTQHEQRERDNKRGGLQFYVQFFPKEEGRERREARVEVKGKEKDQFDLREMGEEIFGKMKTKQQLGDKHSFHKEKKSKPVKPEYSQYTHFVIPLYKYPGNSLATIFIPLLLLALLSLALFFQDNNLSDRIALIATMVLGYIQLIPAVKN